MIDVGIESDLARVLADAAKAMDVPGTLETTLDVIARSARDSVSGFDQVGVTVVQGDGVVTTLAATDRLVIGLDAVQYKFGQGPCLDALREGRVVAVENLPDQRRRWPLYAPQASKAGVRSQMGVQIHTSDATLGSLNFYSTTGLTIDAGAPHDAALFATHAAIALDLARRTEDAAAAIPTRELIGRAVGMLMSRFDVADDRAMYYLVRIAAASDSTLTAAARAVVDQMVSSAD